MIGKEKFMKRAVLGRFFGSAAGAYTVLKLAEPYINNWGATLKEQHERIPGVEKLGSAPIVSTHAITIHAPPSEVWPWIVQVGQGRGGFYSYTWLENLVGCEMKNADRIIPEFQNLKVGDQIYLHPKAPPLSVTHLEPEKVLALEGWIFYLKPQGRNSTRLIVRSHAMDASEKVGRVANFVFQTTAWHLAHFIMERRMLSRIKELAEGSAPAPSNVRSLL